MADEPPISDVLYDEADEALYQQALGQSQLGQNPSSDTDTTSTSPNTNTNTDTISSSEDVNPDIGLYDQTDIGVDAYDDIPLPTANLGAIQTVNEQDQQGYQDSKQSYDHQPSHSNYNQPPSDSTVVGNEMQRKVFVGGLSWETSDETFHKCFSQFGTIVDSMIMRDKHTGTSRGFGFVLYETVECADKALAASGFTLDGRRMDCKRAVPRGETAQSDAPVRHQRSGGGGGGRDGGRGGRYDGQRGGGYADHQGGYDNPSQGPSSSGPSNPLPTNVPPSNPPSNPPPTQSRKVFVGGLTTDTTQEEFRAYFDQFGPIAEAMIMTDRVSGRSRGFGFVTFETDDAVEAVIMAPSHSINGKNVECKRAQPKEALPLPSHLVARQGGGGMRGNQQSGYGPQRHHDGTMMNRGYQGRSGRGGRGMSNDSYQDSGNWGNPNYNNYNNYNDYNDGYMPEDGYDQNGNWGNDQGNYRGGNWGNQQYDQYDDGYGQGRAGGAGGAGGGRSGYGGRGGRGGNFGSGTITAYDDGTGYDQYGGGGGAGGYNRGGGGGYNRGGGNYNSAQYNDGYGNDGYSGGGGGYDASTSTSTSTRGGSRDRDSSYSSSRSRYDDRGSSSSGSGSGSSRHHPYAR